MSSSSRVCQQCGQASEECSLGNDDAVICPSCRAQAAVETTPAGPELPPSLSSKFLQTVLNPRSIQWMLLIGGGLFVLGLLIYLVSIGLFKNPLYAATALGLGSVALLASGWAIVLKTRYHTIGRAFTFLACVVLPLNLWFYDTQGLLTVEGELWLAGLVCCTFYVATIFFLRDPLFVYALEAGITLTVLLFLGHRGWEGHVSAWSVACLILGLCSLHLELAFPKGDEETFSRKRFGKPCFHSGLLQIIAGTSILLIVQLIAWLAPPQVFFLGYDWSAGQLVRLPWLAGTLWLLTMYAWWFTEWNHPSKGLYTTIGTCSLLMAEVTLVFRPLHYERVLGVMTLTAFLFQCWLSLRKSSTDDEREHRLGWIGLMLLTVPACLGILLQVRTLLPKLFPAWLMYQVGSYYVPVMLCLWMTTILASVICRGSSGTRRNLRQLGVLVLFMTVSEALRKLGYPDWSIQGACLALIPIGYLVASRLRRDTAADSSLAEVALFASRILAIFVIAPVVLYQPAMLRSFTGNRDTLFLGLISLELALFYLLARRWQGKAIHLYAGMAFLSLAIWQFLSYFGINPTFYAAAYAAFGMLLMVVARIRGIRETTVELGPELKSSSCQGPGLIAFQCGTGIYLFSLGAILLQGMARLVSNNVSYHSLWAIGVTVLINILVILLAPTTNWRRTYVTGLISQGILFLLTLNRLSLLNGWQKLEILSVAIGLFLVAAGCVGRLREREGQPDFNVYVNLTFGSVFAVAPLFIASLYFRCFGTTQSLVDEITLITVSILLLLLGLTLQLKMPTVAGGTSLTLYLIILIGRLAYQPQIAVGVYILLGGGLLFAAGVLLSLYRERLLALPEKIARREGVFRIIDWR